MTLFSRKVVDLCERPLEFHYGIAYTISFNNKLVRVFMNNSKRIGSKFGYAIIDPDTMKVIKYCRACSFDNVKQAVILN